MHWEMWEMRTHLSCSFNGFFCLKTEQIVMRMFIECLLVKLISNWFHFHCPRIFVVIAPDQVFCPSLESSVHVNWMMTAVVGDAAGCGPITQHQAAVCVSPGRRNNSTTARAGHGITPRRWQSGSVHRWLWSSVDNPPPPQMGKMKSTSLVRSLEIFSFIWS